MQVGKNWGSLRGKIFARERQTASACPIGQNAETIFSSSLSEFFGGARNLKIGEEILLRRSPAKGGARRHCCIGVFQKL